MATREELLALLVSRRRGLSIRPVAPGHDASWAQWLGHDVAAAAVGHADRDALITAAANSARRADEGAEPPRGRVAQLHALTRQGWARERDEPKPLRRFAFSSSLLLNLLFVIALVWLTWLKFFALQASEEETVRVQIVGLGTPEEAGGGDEAAAGDVQPASAAATSPTSASSASASASRATASATAANPSAPPAAEAEAGQPAPAPAEQPLVVSEIAREPSDFELPPTRVLDIRQPSIATAEPRPVPSERDIPTPLPSVRSLPTPQPNRTQIVQTPTVQPSERELPTAAEPSPTMPVRQIAVRPAGLPALRVPENSTRPLPSASVGDAASAASPNPASTGTASTSAAQAGSSTRPAQAPTPGLPGATGQAARPGQQAANLGVGPAARTADSGWPSPNRNDDWGDARRNRVGAAGGGDRGNPRGQGAGSGLFDSEGRPRLADDSFKPRFPDPYKEGTWLKRPSLGYRGTIFDGIWRPPETLLQEWVRKGLKTVDIPLPGGRVKIRCVVSVLQAAGGCMPVGGINGVHDQPAIARPPPDIPFKRELFEEPGALSAPKPAPQPPEPGPDGSGTPL